MDSSFGEKLPVYAVLYWRGNRLRRVRRPSAIAFSNACVLILDLLREEGRRIIIDSPLLWIEPNKKIGMIAERRKIQITRSWKKVEVEYGKDFLEISVPRRCDILAMKSVTPVSRPRAEIERALSHPVAGPTLEEIVKSKGKSPARLAVAIAVSDITRPVPYKGENGLLFPLLKRLEDSGIPKKNVKLIVGTGFHRPSTFEEKKDMFGESVVRDFAISDHACERRDLLVKAGRTSRGTPVYVNHEFCRADIRIATGLVESHFMAGASGGRKSVCPALVDRRTIERFHGPEFLESPLADNLVLEGNPCHTEAVDIARIVGVDFILNVTLDRHLRLTRAFAGEMIEAHLAAYNFMKDYTAVPVDRDYDIVLTHSGYVGRNHYQAAKAACGAIPAVKYGGFLIIVARHSDPDPIGGAKYRKLIRILKKKGVEGYLRMIRHPEWTFTEEQWEPEVWGRALRRVGEEGLIYCSLDIPKDDYRLLPGRCGLDFLNEEPKALSAGMAREMVQNAVLHAINVCQSRGFTPSLAFIPEGPYAVPVRDSSSVSEE
jgi:nickel-dependent lactate racemase